MLHQTGSVALIGAVIAARTRHRRWEHFAPLRLLDSSPAVITLGDKPVGTDEWATATTADDRSVEIPV